MTVETPTCALHPAIKTYCLHIRNQHLARETKDAFVKGCLWNLLCKTAEIVVSAMGCFSFC